MTKEELKKELLSGATIDQLFDLCDGQECLIYKGNFEVSNEISYIPDVFLNGLWKESTAENIDEILEQCYTGNDFVRECNGHVSVAERLFEFVDWQHPNVRDMLETYDEDEFKNEFGYPMEEFNEEKKNEIYKE